MGESDRFQSRGGSHLWATVAAIMLWSTSFVGTKLAYESFPPLTLGACRFVIAALLLAGVLVARRQLVRPERKDLGTLCLSGFLGITLYFSMENVGVSLTSASNAALIVASYPAITLAMERMIYGTKISWLQGGGVLMAMFGVYLISSADAGNMEGEKLVGNIILAATGIVWALYNFVTRKVVNRYPALTVSFYQTVAGAVAFVPLTLFEAGQWRVPSAGSLAVLVYLGIFCSVAAFMMYNFGLRRLSAGTAVTLLNLVPVFGVLFSVLILRETVSAAQILGGAVVIAGVIISVRHAGARTAPSPDLSKG